MPGCGYCHICTPKQCPKEGKERENVLLHVGLSKKTLNGLNGFCEETGTMRGAEYYKVHDYNLAIQKLLDVYNKKK